MHGRTTGKHGLTNSSQCRLGGSHHLPPYSIICAWPRGLHPNVKLGVPKFPKLGFLQLWRPITSCVDLWLKWGLKKCCIPHQNLFNSMWHATYTQVNQGDSWLLVVENQIGKLTPILYFSHNLCFQYPNGSCEPILDIYVPMSFDPWNYLLKIRESIGTTTPKLGAHLGMWGSFLHSPTFLGAWNVTPGLHSWPSPL